MVSPNANCCIPSLKEISPLVPERTILKCFYHVRGMIKNYVDFPHYLITDTTNVSKFLLMIHGLKRNRCGKFGQLKLMH